MSNYLLILSIFFHNENQEFAVDNILTDLSKMLIASNLKYLINPIQDEEREGGKKPPYQFPTPGNFSKRRN